MRRGVLVLTPYLPWPPRHGGRIRTLRLLEGLLEHFEITLVCGMGESDRPSGVMALTNLGCRLRTAPLRPRSPRSPRERALKAVRACAGRSYMLRRWYEREFEEMVAEEARAGHDLVILDHIWMAPYLRALPGLPVIFNPHNVESRALSRAAALERGGSRVLAGFEASALARAERRAMQRAALTVCVSDEDAARLRALSPTSRVEVVANGAEIGRLTPLPPRAEAGPPTLLFVGGYDYPPNLDAARRIATEILPAIRARHHEARALLVGRDPTGALQAWKDVPGLEVRGPVEQLGPLFAATDAVVVPLRFGGGSRLKIVEAWARGRPVLSTGVGAEGLDAADGEHLLLAESGADFADAFDRLLADQGLRERIVTAARARAEERHDWKCLAARFREHCEEIARSSSGRSAP